MRRHTAALAGLASLALLCATWNVHRSLKFKLEEILIALEIGGQRPHIIALQEVGNSSPEVLASLASGEGYAATTAAPVQEVRRSTIHSALLIRKDLAEDWEPQNTPGEIRFVANRLKSCNLTVLSVYSPARGSTEQSQLLPRIARVKKAANWETLLLGDLNVHMGDEEGPPQEPSVLGPETMA